MILVFLEKGIWLKTWVSRTERIDEGRAWRGQGGSFEAHCYCPIMMKSLAIGHVLEWWSNHSSMHLKENTQKRITVTWTLQTVENKSSAFRQRSKCLTILSELFTCKLNNTLSSLKPGNTFRAWLPKDEKSWHFVIYSACKWNYANAFAQENKDIANLIMKSKLKILNQCNNQCLQNSNANLLKQAQQPASPSIYRLFITLGF